MGSARIASGRAKWALAATRCRLLGQSLSPFTGRFRISGWRRYAHPRAPKSAGRCRKTAACRHRPAAAGADQFRPSDAHRSVGHAGGRLVFRAHPGHAVERGGILVSAESYLATHARGRFRLSFAGFGPTELRLVLAAGAIAAVYKPWVLVFGVHARLFDIGGLAAAGGMVVAFIASAIANTCALYRAEPLSDRPNADTVDASSSGHSMEHAAFTSVSLRVGRECPAPVANRAIRPPTEPSGGPHHRTFGAA